MKNKLTNQQKLANRVYRIPARFYYLLYRIIMSGFVARKYHPHYTIKDNIKDCKGPCVVIWNHLSRLDHAFVMEATAPRRINILAGYNEFFRSHLHLVFKLMNIIPKKNYVDDLYSIKAMYRIVKKGGALAFSPEGMSSIYGTNQPIIPGTGRFLQFFDVPVYFVKIAGSYLTSTKVCLDERPGRVEVELSLLFSQQQLREMKPEELDDRINEAFRHDDYAWNKEKRIKWGKTDNICRRLNDICYKCPKCGAEIQMSADGRTIRCENCGNGATMDEYYDFHPFDDSCIIPESPSKWVEWERGEVIRTIRENPQYSYTVDVRVGNIPEYEWIRDQKTSCPCGEGKLTVDHEGMHFVGTRKGEEWAFNLPYSQLFSLVIVTSTEYFALYVDGEYYDFYPDAPVVGKLLLVTEEMHRLHENTWKNFKWMEHLYQIEA